MVRTIKTSWLAFKLDCPIKYGLEAVGINYQKATSGRLVLLISRFVRSLSLAILISQKSLGNHPDNLDANALTCWRFEAVYILIL